MSILATGDWHLNDKNVIHNTIIINYMNFLQNYMKEKNIKNFVFLGDLIHTSNKLNYNTFTPVFKKFMEWKDIGIKSYFIIGNHDQLSKDTSLIELLEPLGKVIMKPETIEIDGFEYDFCPYTEDVNDLPNTSSVLFSHLDLKDFYYNKSAVSKKEIFTTETFHNYNQVLLGHFHLFQQKGKINYVGAPVQMSYAEEGDDKYFAIIDENIVEFYQYEDAPTYMTIDINDFKDYDKEKFKNKFVKVRIDSKIENFVKLKNVLYEYGAIDVAPEFYKNENLKDESGHSVDLQKGVLTSMTKYLGEVKVKEIDNKKLLNIFKELLKEIA